MAGHLALDGDGTGASWGPGVGSSSIAGGPYHFKLDKIDNVSLGSQDNQIMGADILPPPGGSITIIKDAVPSDAQDFAFTGTGPSGYTFGGGFSLDDDSDPTLPNSITVSSLAAGTYTVTEGSATGWSLTNLVCADPTTNSTVNIGTRVATIVLAAGESVTCTFTNTQQTGSLTISKVFSAGQSGFAGNFTIAYDCSTGTAKDGTVTLAAGASQTITGIPTGDTCTVTETTPTPPTGWTFGAPVITPTNGVVTIGNNTTVTVTVTNSITQNQTFGSLTISKVFNAGNSGFTGSFTINYDCTGTTNDGTVTLAADTNQTVSNIPTGASCTVTEPNLPTAPSGWTFGSPVITDNSGTTTDGVVTIGNNTTVNATVTNSITQNPPANGRLLIQKRVDDLDTDTLYDDAGGTFTFLNGSTPFGTTVAGGTAGGEFGYTVLGTLTAGSYTISEQSLSGWTNRGGRTFHGDGNCSTNISETNLVSSLQVTITAGQDTYVCWYNQQVQTAAPSIDIQKTPDNQTIASGGTASFTITVTNTGNVPLTSVTVTDPAAPNCNKAIGALAAGATYPAYSCTLANVTAGLTNTANVVGTAPNEQQVTDSDTAVVTIQSGGGGGGGGGSSATPTPTVQVLGSNAQILKVRTSADPARVGERVNFTVTLSITGDTTVTGVTLTDTFEHAYLRYVASAPAGCTVTPNVPDASRSQISCPIGDVTPGTSGNAGTRSFAYSFAFDALAPTPTRTVNSVIARADLDGTGPQAPANIGPSTADVQIIDLPVALPKAGDGSMGLMAATPLQWSLLALVALAVGAAFAAASGQLNRREQ